MEETQNLQNQEVSKLKITNEKGEVTEIELDSETTNQLKQALEESQRKQTRRDIALGTILFISGIIITGLSYIILEGSAVIFTYGMILLGICFMVRGFYNLSKENK